MLHKSPLLAIFASRRQVLENCRAGGSELSLFIPTPALPPLKAEVAIVVSFKDCPERFDLQGVVSFHRAVARSRTQPVGVVIRFDGPAQKKKASQFFAFCAGRPIEEGTSANPRARAETQCIIELPRGQFSAEVRDISNTGAFVAADEARVLREGLEIKLRLKPIFGRFGGQEVGARVVWVGAKYGLTGAGVRFAGEPDQIRKAVATVRA